MSAICRCRSSAFRMPVEYRTNHSAMLRTRTNEQPSSMRRGEVQAHDPEDRCEKPFGLPEWQMEEETERQCGFDGEVGVLRLPATRADAHGFPGPDGLR
jgi:hypothetical protein